MRKVIFLLITLCGAWINAPVFADVVRGTFASGQSYVAQYSVAEMINKDGMTVERVTVAVKLNGSDVASTYTYDADAPPVVRASSLGYLLIAVKSGGMEGSITYNYLVLLGEKISSIGAVTLQLHLGKTDSIDIYRGNEVSDKNIDDTISKIVSLNSGKFYADRNSYPGAAMLFLGRVNYKSIDGYNNLLKLLADKDISSDPKFSQKLVLILNARAASKVPQGSRQDRRRIVSDKAYLLGSPDSNSAAKGYLIKGDEVAIIEQSADKRYWEVIYDSAKLGQIKRWIRCEDVDLCNQ